MKTLTAGAVLALAIFGAGITPALAHAHISSMSISEGAKIEQSPPAFDMKFSEKVGLVKITLMRSPAEDVPLNYAPPKDMAESFKVPLPLLTPGAYMLSWKTIGDDGHAMNGGVRFTIAGK